MFGRSPVEAAGASAEFSQAFPLASEDERGAVFTSPHVAEFILDLVGYRESERLWENSLLEPGFGDGSFLIPAAKRLVRSYLNHGLARSDVVARLKDAILGVEIHRESVAVARGRLALELISLGLDTCSADELCRTWLVEGDFLLMPINRDFSHVVGNPPYVRQELIPDELLKMYRATYRTLFDRADLYVPFFERGLQLLAVSGRLAFICTDRWTKNKYGGPLRSMVSRGYCLTHFVDMVGTQPFREEVTTYPAITVIERSEPTVDQPTRVAYRPTVEAEALASLASSMTARFLPEGGAAIEIRGVVRESEPWLLHELARLELVRRLESAHPVLESAGCKVGIGVATGCDAVFIRDFATLDVEEERKLPLVRTQDIASGGVVWGGMGVLNPFEPDGRLADLERYPRFARYLERNASSVKARNVAKKNPARWYRTIDRIYAELTAAPKLLIPDIKGDALVVYEEGRFYPHHNLYYITSSEWDLRALQAVLISGIAKLFVATYSTAMRGGALRFQAQYLRRIRVPRWSDVPEAMRQALRAAAEVGDLDAANRATFQLFDLSEAEQKIVLGE